MHGMRLGACGLYSAFPLQQSWQAPSVTRWPSRPGSPPGRRGASAARAQAHLLQHRAVFHIRLTEAMDLPNPGARAQVALPRRLHRLPAHAAAALCVPGRRRRPVHGGRRARDVPAGQLSKGGRGAVRRGGRGGGRRRRCAPPIARPRRARPRTCRLALGGERGSSRAPLEAVAGGSRRHGVKSARRGQGRRRTDARYARPLTR